MSYSSQFSDADKAQDSAARQLRESVSALMDGEAEALELRRLLNPELRGQVDDCWRRYQRVREVLDKHDLPDSGAFLHLDISQRVSAAIASEPLPLAAQKPTKSYRPAWLKPVAGMAVAASVAVAVVFGVRSIEQAPSGLNNPTEAAPSLASHRVYPVAGGSVPAAVGKLPQLKAPQVSAPQVAVTQPMAQLPVAQADSRALAEQEARKRLEKYLLRHTENAALNNGQGMISFARVASFETE